MVAQVIDENQYRTVIQVTPCETGTSPPGSLSRCEVFLLTVEETSGVSDRGSR